MLEIRDLAQRDDLFRVLVNTIKDYAIFVLDPDGIVTTWNDGAKRIKGYEADEIIGKHFSVFYPAELRKTGHPDHELKVAVREGRYEEEGERLRKDGSTFWANVVITALFDDSGNHIGFAKVTRDLTERRRIQERLELANFQLTEQLVETDRYRRDAEEARNIALQASALKSEFVANISHEIRTPMSGILGLAELLAMDSSGSTREVTEAIYHSARNLMHLVNDILDFSKFESGLFVLVPSIFSIDGLFDDVLTAQYVSARNKNLKITSTVDERLAQPVVGDENKLRQVIQNFVSNAIKFTNTGSIELRASLLSEDTEGKRIRFSVSDTGPGIAPEKLDLLFKLFTQIDGSTTRKHGGTGLGLALSKRIVEYMNGSIGVDSDIGAGSTFWFEVTLPHSL